MNGLKNVRNRRDDALTRVDWKQLEKMLADHYRRQGWSVDHVGTGASRSRFDGGVDLKLRRGGEYVLIQCKHWNAKQVPHNAVHELLGLKINQNATGAIVITSGEFTQAAKDAAAREGHVQLIDGDALRAMLGPLPETSTSPADLDRTRRPDCLGQDKTARRPVSGQLNKKPSLEPLVRLGVGIIALVILVQCVPGYFRKTIEKSVNAPAVVTRPKPASVPMPPPVQRPVVINVERQRPQPPEISAQQQDTALREWQRKNAESMRILEENDRRYEEALMEGR
ncbi:restriction endonuclease [Pseudoxanthomonas gei]|uniref:Restriction endonuclease n=1 Tax=Pseudoxanthomonas gei TaxID=1383030 RepID=A0ABX0A7T7_9GAMM|nr:restriction endonuclease [Pseudoxanthomonas gei]NDK37551.1 restriction endonuclease [Pseudoxanthomonas gei]